MTYKYLYQDRENRNCEGEIKAGSREDAYRRLRKQGIRPYRLIGDDPVRWQPFAVSAGYAVLLAAIVALAVMRGSKSQADYEPRATLPPLSSEEAKLFRERAEDAVYRAPEAYRYNVWKGVNARLVERGLEPLERPEGLEEEPFLR